MERRLAAILVADVVGYSRLMEQDETGAFERLRAHRKELFEPAIERHHGRVFKLMGDGLLAEFASVVDAVECAGALQQGMVERNSSLADGQRIDFRIGINLGDVIVEGDDRHGEGVNIAARLQEIAGSGGICVSAKVHDEVHRKLSFAFDDMGERQFKNIAAPIRVYRVAGVRESVPSGGSLPLPAKPSIAVLPFTNISADAEQEFFADGLTEDLITELSKAPGLFVIARHSSFAFKNKSVDVRRVAQDLGVRYILEGSARRASGRIRINAQLIDAHEGAGHLWAERFDRDLADVFAVQDEVIGKIVEALVGKLTVARLRERYRPASLEAYDLCLRGRAEWAHSVEAGVDAIPLFEKAITLDPRYADAYRWLALGQSRAWLHMNRPMDPFRQLSMSSAKKAVELDPEDAGAHWALATVLLYERLWAESAKEFEISLRLNPNEADAWDALSDLKVMEGRGEEAVACSVKALRLSPHPTSPYLWSFRLNTPPASMRRRLRRCATRRHIALAPGVSSPRLLHSLAGWRRRAKKADSISREIHISGLAIGWKLSPFAIWPHETGLSKAIARLACQSESSDIAGAAALESALGTSETNGFSRFESAIG